MDSNRPKVYDPLATFLFERYIGQRTLSENLAEDSTPPLPQAYRQRPGRSAKRSLTDVRRKV